MAPIYGKASVDVETLPKEVTELYRGEASGVR
jgi:hypothetical protein